MKMTDREMLARNALGEATLGDVVRMFEDQIVNVHVYSKGGYVNVTSCSWGISESDNTLDLFGEDSLDFSFDLSSKAKIFEDKVRIEHEGQEFLLMFLTCIRFDQFVPGAC